MLSRSPPKRGGHPQTSYLTSHGSDESATLAIAIGDQPENGEPGDGQSALLHAPLPMSAEIHVAHVLSSSRCGRWRTTMHRALDTHALAEPWSHRPTRSLTKATLAASIRAFSCALAEMSLGA